MNIRQERKANTKKHIVETAFNQFAINGITATRTVDIAVAANLSHGTIFSHFATREILIDEVIEEFGLRVSTRLYELIEANCGIKELLEAHLECIREYEGFYIRLISEASVLHESAANSLLGIQSGISFDLIQAAEHEMELNKIKKMPLHLLFNTWNGLINYYLMNKNLFAPGESVILVYKHQLVDHFMNLISLREEVN